MWLSLSAILPTIPPTYQPLILKDLHSPLYPLHAAGSVDCGGTASAWSKNVRHHQRQPEQIADGEAKGHGGEFPADYFAGGLPGG